MEDSGTQRRFGTFTGVFTPTLLTILGVIMFVRLGWVVGNAGLGGALMILAIGLGITICTGLSLSSIATNTQVGDGGPYAIISKSLGFEVGGSVGIPLYLSRPLGVAMYIIGFREGWQWIFPDHNALAVDMIVFGALLAISWLSAELAFKVQYLIMAIIIGSLVSIFASEATFQAKVPITWWGEFPGFPEDEFQGIGFWGVFAVFFPATTGILAGANMSGELKDPRRAIPVGALWAIGVSSVIYIALAIWAAVVAPMEELAGEYNLFIDYARWPSLVVAGLLGATFSSALAGIVGGPRILRAMGAHRLLPGSTWLAKTRADGEPTNALAVTGVLTFLCLMVRDLNDIALLVTMFFLITYAFLNLVVLVEASLNLISFRPTLRVSRLVPLLGLTGSLLAMFIMSPIFGAMSVTFVMAIYAWLARQGVGDNGEDVRSGIFVSLAEWAAARVTDLPQASIRAWKPNMLVPVEDPETLRGEFFFIVELARPEGSVKLLGLATRTDADSLRPQVEGLAQSFHEDRLFCSWAVLSNTDFGGGVVSSLQALQSAFFRPNILFLTAPNLTNRHDEFRELIMEAGQTGVGVMVLGVHPRAGLGQKRRVHCWISPRGPDWSIEGAFEKGNLNLTLLTAYRLVRQWDAEVRLMTVIPPEERPAAEEFMGTLCELARMGKHVRWEVFEGVFRDVVQAQPAADLTILGLQRSGDLAFMHSMVELSRGSCLAVLDSGRESALA
jgi:solute carrier family 12 (sodium/potassium/chloride transporter), member 2